MKKFFGYIAQKTSIFTVFDAKKACIRHRLSAFFGHKLCFFLKIVAFSSFWIQFIHIFSVEYRHRLFSYIILE